MSVSGPGGIRLHLLKTGAWDSLAGHDYNNAGHVACEFILEKARKPRVLSSVTPVTWHTLGDSGRANEKHAVCGGTEDEHFEGRR